MNYEMNNLVEDKRTLGDFKPVRRTLLVRGTVPTLVRKLISKDRAPTRNTMGVQKTLESILAGSKNIGFSDFIKLVEAYGFRLSRIEGSHHIFKREHVRELVNLQNVNGKAKPYQMRQVLSLVEKYNLQLHPEEKP